MFLYRGQAKYSRTSFIPQTRSGLSVDALNTWANAANTNSKRNFKGRTCKPKNFLSLFTVFTVDTFRLRSRSKIRLQNVTSNQPDNGQITVDNEQRTNTHRTNFPRLFNL